MAVEAQHLNHFSPRIISSRGPMMNSVEGIRNVYGNTMGYGVLPPLSGTTATETMVPMYGSAIKSDSGLTYAVPVSRKRSRDASNPFFSSLPTTVHDPTANNRCGSFTFLGEDFSFHFQQQQVEIDRVIAQHTAKLRMEMEERRKRYSRRIAEAVGENIMKKLRVKEEEIEKIGKLNLALEERVKSLCAENQIWRDVAQTNEATANVLRCNLQHVLAQVQEEQQPRRTDEVVALMDEAQSYCGSNFEETGPAESPPTGGDVHRDGCIGPGSMNRMCRNCGKEESCVLLLPCRHLCLCTVCGSSLHTCPVCNSVKNASVHVNLSGS